VLVLGESQYVVDVLDEEVVQHKPPRASPDSAHLRASGEEQLAAKRGDGLAGTLHDLERAVSVGNVGKASSSRTAFLNGSCRSDANSEITPLRAALRERLTR
jgi:hypothetical protein